MSKYVFWNAQHKNALIALTETLGRYALGETFWQALGHLLEAVPAPIPSATAEESDFAGRLRMYQETGIHKVEIFVEKNGSRFAVRCANSQSVLAAASEEEALRKYVAVRAKTSAVNTGEPGV
jgi:hypothetical protein